MTQAQELISALEAIADPSDVAYVSKFYQGGAAPDRVMGVRMPKVFPLAKQFVETSLEDIDVLLSDARYEVRMAAVSIMDFQARKKSLDPSHRKALFDLFLARSDRLDNWDFVDRAAPFVIGEFLVEKDRSILDVLAASDNPHERRTALVATYAFIKRGEVADTFLIAGKLCADPDEYVQKAIGAWTREAGKRDQSALISFLRTNRNDLPRTTKTAAAKHLPADTKAELANIA